jgi:hypothetical protein
MEQSITETCLFRYFLQQSKGKGKVVPGTDGSDKNAKV